MSIELTEEQRQAIRRSGETPPRVVDPQTRETFVLLRADVYEQLEPLLPAGPPSAISPEVPPGIRRAKEAFLRDLPDMLADKKLRRRWVAYCGDERIATAPTQTAVIQRCQRRGLRQEEYHVDRVVPHAPEPEVVDPSFFEFEEVPSEGST